MSWQEILQGLNAGREQAHKDYDVWWQWVFDIVRDVPDTQERYWKSRWLGERWVS